MILARFGGGPRAGTAAPAASPTAAPAGAGRWSERLPTARRHCAASAAPAAAPPACQSASQRGRCCSTSTTASHRPGAWNPPAVGLVLASRTAATAARAGDWMNARRSSPRLSMVRRRGRGRVVGVGGGCAAMADAMSAGLSSAAVWLLCSYCGGSAAGVGWLFDCALAAPTAGHGRRCTLRSETLAPCWPGSRSNIAPARQSQRIMTAAIAAAGAGDCAAGTVCVGQDWWARIRRAASWPTRAAPPVVAALGTLVPLTPEFLAGRRHSSRRPRPSEIRSGSRDTPRRSSQGSGPEPPWRQCAGRAGCRLAWLSLDE